MATLAEELPRVVLSSLAARTESDGLGFGYCHCRVIWRPVRRTSAVAEARPTQGTRHEPVDQRVKSRARVWATAEAEGGDSRNKRGQAEDGD